MKLHPFHYLLSFAFLCLVACTPSDPATTLSGDQPPKLRNYKTYCHPIDIDYTYMSHYRARN